MAARQLSDGRPDGNTFGQSSTDLVSVYNETPVAQAAAISTVTTTAATSTTNAYGFTTAAQADAIVTAINAVIVAITNFGISA